MNLLEAIEQAGDNWFRPIKSIGQGYAYAINKNGDDIFFMGGSRQTNQLCFRSKDITGEWEIVTPDQVIAERK